MVCMALTVALTSCKKNYFDKELAEEITKATFHNDTIDSRHTWSLLREEGITITANVPGIRRIDLLTANPYASDKAELMGTANVEEGNQVVMNYSAPVSSDSIYADAITASGDHIVKAIPTGAMAADFTTLNTKNTGTRSDANKQEIYYCFCNSFPRPSMTWDFNDCVFRISKEVIDDYTLRLNVTLVAMGTLLKTAAAIRLPEVDYDQVESITAVGNRTFVRNTEVERTFITHNELMLKAMDGSVVVNLFDDGHLAFYSRVSSTGELYRYYYNVSRTINSTYTQFATPSVSYDIKFKQKDMAKRVNFTALDPFIICANNGLLVEIHKYRYKLDQVLSRNMDNPQDYNNCYTWVLEIPYSWFRYPLEGNAMGSYKGRAVYGTYSTLGHAFGEWGADRTKATDWYLYPETSMVY